MSDETNEESPSLDELLSDMDEDDDLSKVIKTLLDPKNLHHLTELSNEEITAFSTLGTMASKYNIVLLQEWLLLNLTLRVSKGRAGRKEFVRITQRIADDNNLPHKRGLFDFRRD